MKRCPTCKSTYTDDSLFFCLQDGAQLAEVSASHTSFDPEVTLRETAATSSDAPLTGIVDPRALPTAQISASTAVTSQLPSSSQTHVAQAENLKQSFSIRTRKGLYIGVGALLLLLAVVGIASLFRSPQQTGARIWGGKGTAADNFNGFGDTPAGTTTTNTTPTPSPADQTNKLSIAATASSTRANYKGYSYAPANVLDGSGQTAWAEGVTGPGVGEWIRCDFNREVSLRRITIAPGYFKNRAIWQRNNRVASVTISFSDGSSREFSFPDRMERKTLDVGGVKTSWVRIVIKNVYHGDDADTTISEITFDVEP